MIMIDLEGVLSDHTDRLALLKERTEGRRRDRTAWKNYYKAIMDDQPRIVIMDMVHDWLAEDIRPIIYSTRFRNKYKHEEEWLRKHELWGHVEFIQREPHQTQIKGPDLVVQWVQQYRPDLIIDDRREVGIKLQIDAPTVTVYHPNDFEDADT